MSRPYPSIRDKLRTGDIVLFSGNSLVSRLIRFASRGEWSHVGMVVRVEELDGVMVWESTSLDGQDVLTDKPLAGVGLTWLSERVRHYDGVVAVRRLHVHANDEPTERALAPIRKELHGRPYERSRLELLRAAYDGPGGQNAPDLSSIFCSELVAETWKRLGLLIDVAPSNEFTPEDFAREDFPGLRGRLGPIEMIARGEKR